MRDRPFTKLFIAIGVFVVVSLVFAHFRHGFNIIGLVGVLIGTVGSAACLNDFIWPIRSGSSALRRLVSLLDFAIVGLLTTLFLLGANNLSSPRWVALAFTVLCVCKAFYLWFEHRQNKLRKNTVDSLQARLIERNRKRVV